MRKRERDRREEMEAHLALYADELIARGRTPADAHREARLRFGNPRVKLEEIHTMNRLPLIDMLGRDLRYAVRVLRRSPAFSATTVLTLALAIGANSAVFSLANAILIKPLPYPQPERLAFVEARFTGAQGEQRGTGQDGAAWEAIREVGSIDAAVIGGGFGQGANLVVGNAPRIVRQQRVSAGYFRVLDVQPLHGREFTPDEDRAGGPPAAVLSYGLWRQAFGGDTTVIGRAITLRGQPSVVVGVMPESFENLYGDTDVWTPLRASTSGEGGGTNFEVIARLKATATWTRAESDLAAASVEVLKSRAKYFGEGTRGVLGLRPMAAVIADGARSPIVTLGAAVGAVLLIACFNIAALLLARGGTRAREIATRMAIGGTRADVVRQLMVEAAVLGLVGGGLGLLAGAAGLEGLKALGAQTYSEWQRVTLDGRVVAVTMGLSLLTSVLFGLVPAWQSSRLDVQSAIRDGGSRAVAGASKHWPRRLLVITEVACGVALLVVAGLLVRTLLHLRGLEPGFDSARIVTAKASLQDARYAASPAVARLFEESVARISSQPGVESAAVSLGLPYERLLNMGFRFMDEEPPPSGMIANVTYTSGDLFGTLRVPIEEGRALRDSDRSDSPKVVVVNRMFARVWSKDRPILGRMLRLSGVDREVVGIVGDVRARSAGFFLTGMDRGPLTKTPLIYFPAAQATDGFVRSAHTWFQPVWVVKAQSIAAAAAAIRTGVGTSDPLLPMTEPEFLSATIARSTSQERLLGTLVGLLAAAALLLAAIGIHGLIAQSIAERRRELGIRLALGATPAQTVRAVTLEGVALASVGAVIGGVLSIPAVQLVRTSLWGVGTHDLATYAGVAVALLAVATTASLLPGLKLLRVSPAEILR